MEAGLASEAADAAEAAGAAELSVDVELELHAAKVTEATPTAAMAAKARPREKRLIMWLSLRGVDEWRCRHILTKPCATEVPTAHDNVVHLCRRKASLSRRLL